MGIISILAWAGMAYWFYTTFPRFTIWLVMVAHVVVIVVTLSAGLWFLTICAEASWDNYHKSANVQDFVCTSMEEHKNVLVTSVFSKRICIAQCFKRGDGDLKSVCKDLYKEGVFSDNYKAGNGDIWKPKS